MKYLSLSGCATIKLPSSCTSAAASQGVVPRQLRARAAENARRSLCISRYLPDVAEFKDLTEDRMELFQCKDLISFR